MKLQHGWAVSRILRRIIASAHVRVLETGHCMYLSVIRCNVMEDYWLFQSARQRGEVVLHTNMFNCCTTS